MVTHGLAVSVTSSGVMSGSTSTGLVVAISTWWHSVQPEPGTALALGCTGARVDRPPDRPLRADHAAGGPPVRHGLTAIGLRALRPEAARGAPVRRRGRRRPGPRRARGLQVRRRGATG